jgi:tRNA G18 (ribose-2'-O)-methylase SpoU
MLANFIAIDSSTDPRIAAYRNLKDRDLRSLSGQDAHHGMFVLEGLTVIEKALAGSLYPIQSLLIAENRKDRLATLAAMHKFEGPVYVAAAGVMDHITGFPMHRGVLGIGLRPPPGTPTELIASTLQGEPRTRIMVLCGIANHDNMGGLFRNAAAFGVSAVLLDGACCDPLYRKAIRVSVGASLLVPFARDEDSSALLDFLASRGVRLLALATEGASDLGKTKNLSSIPVALIMGAEGSGLSPQIVARCEAVRIAMVPGFDSLNVATASGIALHHLFQHR